MRCVCVSLPLSVRTAQWDARAPQRAVRLTLAVYFRSVFFSHYVPHTMARTQVLCSNSVASARSCSRVSAHTGRTFFRLLLILLLLVFSSRFLLLPVCVRVCLCVLFGRTASFSPSLSPCCTRLTVGALYTCGYLLLRTRRVFINEIDQ